MFVRGSPITALIWLVVAVITGVNIASIMVIKIIKTSEEMFITKKKLNKS